MLKWKKCQSGIDGMRFECSLELEGIDCRSWPDEKGHFAARIQSEAMAAKRTTNKDLACKDCIHRYDDSQVYGNISRCELYKRKTNAVLLGGKCEWYRNVLNGIFRTAVRWQMIQINPCTAAKVPRNKAEERTLKYFTPEQSLMFLKTLDMTFDTLVRGHQRIDDTGKPYHVNDYTEPRKIPLQLKAFYTMSLYCGFRKGETLALHWSDIDYETKTIRIAKSVGKTEEGVTLKKPKTATSIRAMSFPDAIIPLLKDFQKEYSLYRLSLGTAWQGDGNLFTQWDGKLMGASTPYQSFKRHLERYNEWVRENPKEAKKEGLEELPTIPLHGLRPSCATLLNYLDVNIIDISKILGHAKSSTVN